MAEKLTWVFMLFLVTSWLILSYVHIMHLQNLKVTTEIGINMAGMVQIFCAFFTWHLCRKYTKQIIYTMKNHFWYDEYKYDKDLHDKHNYYYEFTSKISRSYHIICYIFMSIWFFNPSLYARTKFPYDITFPYYNFVKESPYYEIIYILEIVSIFYCGTCIILQDVLYCRIVTFALIQIDFIKYKLKTVITKNSIRDDITKGLKICIIQHNIILEFLENIEIIYRYLMLSKFGGNIVLCCCAKFILQDGINLKSLFLLICTLLQALIYCFFGDFITSECCSIGLEAYEMHWEDVVYKEVRTATCMIIRRTQKPVLMTIGGMVVLSLPNYVAFVKMMFSFYVLLQNMENE